MGHVRLMCRCGEVSVPADEIDVWQSMMRWWLLWSCPCGADLAVCTSEALASEVSAWQRAGKDAAVAAFADEIERCDDLVAAITQGGSA